MKRGNYEIENIFEDDKILLEICEKYFVIEKKLKSKKKPVHEKNIIDSFKLDYKIEITLEEAAEIKDFCQNGDYEYFSMGKINEDNNNYYIGY